MPSYNGASYNGASYDGASYDGASYVLTTGGQGPLRRGCRLEGGALIGFPSS